MNAFNGSKELYRRREGRIIAGVCAGLADYFGVDPTVARLVFALLAVFGGSGILLYLLAWLVIPDEGEKSSIVAGMFSKRGDR